MAERMNTGGASAKEIAQAIKEVLNDSNSMSKTTLKINTDSSIYKAKEEVEGLTEALESYESFIKKKKTNYSKTSYFTTEEKAINRLKNAWEEYAKERNAGIVNDNNLSKSDSAKKVLVLANALEALTGKSNSISEISQEINELVSQMRELPNFKNYSLDTSQFREVFDLLKNIQKLYPDVSEITKPFKGLESTVETLTSLRDIQNSSAYSSTASTASSVNSVTDAYEEQAKAVEKVTEQIKALTEAEMEAKLKSEHNNSTVNEWEIDLDEELEDIQKYSKALDELKQAQRNALKDATEHQNSYANDEFREDGYYLEKMESSIRRYHEYTDQIEFVQERLQKAIHEYTPSANGENGKELNALIVILKDLHEEITKISVAFANIDENSGISNLVKSIQEMNDALIGSIGKIEELGNVLKDKDFNLIFNNKTSSGSNPMANNMIYGNNIRKIIRQLSNEKAELDSFFRELYSKNNKANISSNQAIATLFSGKELGIINSYSDWADVPAKYSTESIESAKTLAEKVDLLREFIDLVERASKVKGIDISPITSKYDFDVDEEISKAQNVITGEREAADSATESLKKLFGASNNINLGEVTANLDEVLTALKSISELIEKGFTVNDILNGKTTDTGEEVKGLEAVKQSVESITTAVNEKTEAFKNEEATVTKIVPNETNYLGKLISSLKIINEQLEKISQFTGLDLSKIKIPETNVAQGKIAEGATTISNNPKEAIKNKVRNVTKADTTMTAEQLAARTKSLTDETAKLESNLIAQGSVIKELTEFYDSQDNLVKTVIKEQQELDGLLKTTTWTTNYDLKNNTSFSSHIDSNRYEDVEKKKERERLEQAKRFANEEKKEKDKLTKESYAIEKKYISEIYLLKEKNAKAIETNSRTQKEDIAYNNMLIVSYEELISDEKEYRREKGLVNDNRNQEYELRLIAEYEARRDAYNVSLKESIKLAEQESYIENAKRNQKENASKSSDLLKEQRKEYEEIYKTILAISKLDTTKDSERIAELKQQGELHVKNYNKLERNLEVYQDIIDKEKQSNELLAIKVKYQNQIDIVKAQKKDEEKLLSNTTSANKSKKQIDEISDAYKGLIQTEKSYQELLAKSEITSLTPQETKNLQDLSNNREKYNQVLSETLVLTEKQFQVQKQYIAKQEEVQKNLGNYKDLTATEHNQEAIKAYEELIKKSKDYYYYLKSNEDSLLPQEKKMLEQLEKAWEEAYLAKGKYSTVDLGSDKVKEELENIRNYFQNNESKAYKQLVRSYANKMQDKYNRLELNKKDFKYVDEYYQKMDLLKAKIKELQNYDLTIIDKDKIKDVKVLEQEIGNLYNETNSMTKNFTYQLAEPEEIKDTMTKIRKTLADNTAMPSDLKELFKALEKKYQLLVDTKGTEKQFRELNEELADLNYQLQKSGKTGDSFFTSIVKRTKSITTSFISMYLSMYDIARYGKEVFEVIKEYDDNLAEMNKVSEESVQTLRKFQKESFELANSVGTTASAIQSSTADFMRLGESLEEAKKSAQDANTLFQVSEFENISEATDALVAMSAAYSDLEKSQINDVLNEIGNNYAISTDELASALQRSAATLKVAGNDIYEAAALVTAGKLYCLNIW